ncbi:hypothetical protein LTR08_007143 [Meristemomyces frigidus]|nr:hypothetical protein LTR08_007143 [Meristemomyces frigidus]
MPPLPDAQWQQEAQQKAYMDYQTPALTSGRSHVTEDNEVIHVALAPAVKSAANKRPLKTQGVDETAASKRTKQDAHVKRLVANYDEPKSAQKLVVPNESEGSDMFEDRRRAGYTKGGFKPKNTLNQTPHAPKSMPLAGPSDMSSDLYAGRKRPRNAQTQGKLDMAASMGSNVGRKGAATQYGDGFDLEERSAKRQRADGDDARSWHGGQTVDLTAEGRKGSGSTVTSVSMARDKFSTATSRSPSHAPSAKNVSQEYNYCKEQHKSINPIPKKPRKKKDPHGRSQASSMSSVVEVDDRRVAGHGAAARSARVVLIEDEGKPQSHAKPRVPQRVIDQAGTVPPITLDKGFDEIGRLKPHGSANNLKGHEILVSGPDRNHGRAPPGKSQANGTSAPLQAAAPQTRSDGSSKSYREPEQPRQRQRQRSPKLSSTFQRDTAKQRMMEDSQVPLPKVAPIGESSSSEDDLQGGNTVGSRILRAMSPLEKMQNGGKSTTPQAPGSPNDIKPTDFTQSRKKRDRQQSASKQKQIDEDDDSPPNSMPVEAFYATSCVIQEGPIRLDYHAPGKELDVFQGIRPAVVAGKMRTVAIGAREAKHVHFSEGNNKVYIKGSSTEVSNGSICIAFQDYKGVEWFINMVIGITDDVAKIEAVPEDRLNKLFSNQSNELRKAWDRAEKIASEQRRSAQEEPASDDNERIVYEKDESEQPRRKSVRKSMQGGQDEEDELSRTEDRRQSPKTSHYFQNEEPLRRTTRQMKPVPQRYPSPKPERWFRINQPKPWSSPVTYPTVGAKRITVEFGDIERLDEGQFLNDNIVSFALRQIEEKMAPEFKDSVHFFNSFFYPSFTMKGGKRAFNYDAVKRWTKNKDIFSMPYIVVPICIDLHWFVAIICNLPNLSRKFLDEGEEPEPATSEAASAPNTPKVDEVDVDNSTETLMKNGQDKLPKDETSAMHKLSISDDGEPAPEREVYAMDDDGHADFPVNNGQSTEEQSAADDAPHAASSKKTKRKAGPSVRRYDEDQPSIITLDSFGSSHGPEIRNLKDYLKAEADSKRGIFFDDKRLKGITAKGIPEQSNFCDCGVYLVGYVEQFARNPRAFVSKVLQRELEEEADFVDFDPSVKRNEIRDELFRLNKANDDAHMARRKQKHEAGQTAKKEPDNQAKLAVPAEPTVSEMRQAAMPLTPVPARTRSSPPPGNLVAQASTAWKPVPAHTIRAKPDIEDDTDELESAPARPLRPAILDQEAQRKSVPSSQGYDNEEAEMLDDNLDHDRNAVGSTSTAVQAPSSDSPLLDDLEDDLRTNSLQDVLTHGPLQPAAPTSSIPNARVDAQTSDDRNSSDCSDEEDEYDPPETMHSQPSHNVQPQRQHRAEVPDSQGTRPTIQSLPAPRRHMKFDD